MEAAKAPAKNVGDRHLTSSAEMEYDEVGGISLDKQSWKGLRVGRHGFTIVAPALERSRGPKHSPHGQDGIC